MIIDDEYACGNFITHASSLPNKERLGEFILEERKTTKDYLKSFECRLFMGVTHNIFVHTFHDSAKQPRHDKPRRWTKAQPTGYVSISLIRASLMRNLVTQKSN